MQLLAAVDETLAQHFAHLWIRDPMAIFSEKIYVDDEGECIHFEVQYNVLFEKSRHHETSFTNA